jgi:tetratricopeptide (TPR) repeat protein
LAEHPSLEQLQDFLQGRMDVAGVRPVVAHLVKGCALCSATLQEILTSPPPDPGYDEAIDRALAAHRWHGPEALKKRARAREALARVEAGGIERLAEAPASLKGVAGCEALLERSWALRHEDPGKMLELASFATLIADRLSVKPHGPRKVADLRCRAWSALGNAYRVADDLDSAEWALGRAAELQLQGTGDEMLAVRLLDLRASLYGAQRRFPAALDALDGVYAIHNRRGDDHLAGRALISKGIYTGYANKPEEAVRLLRDGLTRIDQDRDPQLALSAVHNIAWFLVDCGRFREARSLAFKNRGRYVRHGGTIEKVKLRWLHGLMDAGLGNLAAAEQALKDARHGFQEAGLGYHSALAGLDLASILLREQRPDEARTVVLEATGVFLKLRIEREALGAIVMLKQVFEAGVAAQALLDDAIQFLRRVQHDPTLTFSAWFL